MTERIQEYKGEYVIDSSYVLEYIRTKKRDRALITLIMTSFSCLIGLTILGFALIISGPGEQ